MISFFSKKHIAPWKLKTPGEHNGKVSFTNFTNKSVKADVQGRYVLLEADVQGSNFLFVNVYAPNKVQEQCLF